MEFDLWGNPIEANKLLKDRFIEPPFSILDAKSGHWLGRKNKWKGLGIKSEIGRSAKAFSVKASADKMASDSYMAQFSQTNDTSIFDPALCELVYSWFTPPNGSILDPFAGGSVRGIVANYLGYHYTGIDIRKEQIESNEEQARNILEQDNQPIYYTGDSNKVLDTITSQFDFVFSCPPYANLEVYSDLQGDISNMEYDDFMTAYTSIIAKSCRLLKSDCFACFVVGEVRDKKGNYRGFVPDTVNAFKRCGMHYYNEIIISKPLLSAAIRANNNMRTKKVVKVHENALVFKK